MKIQYAEKNCAVSSLIVESEKRENQYQVTLECCQPDNAQEIFDFLRGLQEFSEEDNNWLDLSRATVAGLNCTFVVTDISIFSKTLYANAILQEDFWSRMAKSFLASEKFKPLPDSPIFSAGSLALKPDHDGNQRHAPTVSFANT